MREQRNQAGPKPRRQTVDLAATILGVVGFALALAVSYFTNSAGWGLLALAVLGVTGAIVLAIYEQGGRRRKASDSVGQRN